MIVTSISDIRMFMPDVVGASNAYDNMKPYLEDYEEKLKEEIGEATFALVDPPEPEVPEEGETPPETVEVDPILLKHCQGYIVYMSYFARLPLMNVLLSDTGIQVEWSDTHRPATPEQLKKSQHTILAQAQKKFEALIKYLNKTKPDAWTTSSNYNVINRLLFKDSATFCRILNMEDSARLLWLMSHTIYRHQTIDLEPLVGKTELEALRAKVHNNTTLSADEETLLNMCLSYLANTAMSQIIITANEEDLPVSLLSIMDKDTRAAYSSRLAAQAKNDLAILQKHVLDVETPEEAPHENIPDNTDTTRKTFRA